MSVNGLDTAYSGMRVQAFRQDVSANNVANVNTEGFRASEVATTDQVEINGVGSGARVAGTYQPSRPAAVQPNAPASGAGVAEMSNTDVAREMTNQLAVRDAYQANANMVRSADEMTRTVLDLRG